MDNEIKRIRLVLNEVVSATWVQAGVSNVLRVGGVTAAMFVIGITGLLLELQARTTVLGMLFAMTGFFVWTFQDSYYTHQGHEIGMNRLTMAEKVYIDSTLEEVMSGDDSRAD